MKNLSVLVVALILGILPLGLPGILTGGIGSSDVPESGGNSWLLLMYMAGDNNLGRDGYEWGNAVKMDIEEMEDSMPSTGMEILALADMEGPNNTFLYDLEHDTYPGIGSPTIPLSDVNPLWVDEVDMSDWKTLRDFLVFALSNRTADHIMFVLWDHGAGWYASYSGIPGSREVPGTRGFALDSNSGGAMFLDGFRDAFIGAESSLGSLDLDLVGFDTCFMGMMEVYYQVSPWFDLALGSEDEEPWYGYNYSFVSVMGGGNPLTPGGLGHFIVQQFRGMYLAPGEYSYATITMVNLSELRRNLTYALNGLCGPLIERMYRNEVQQPNLFRALRGRTEMIGFENLDIGNLLGNLAASDLHPAITENATYALDIYNGTVLDEWHQPDGRNQEATGISIYLPPPGSYRGDYDGTSGFLNFTADSLWDEMIREFHDPVERVRVNLSIMIMDGDGMKDDMTLEVTNPQAGLPIDGARIFLNGEYMAVTGPDGHSVFRNLSPGNYLVEAYNGTHVGEAAAKVLNRPPVPVVTPSSPAAVEGQFITLDGSSSFDPDGDRITFKWDLDASDGLNGSDATTPWVNLSFGGAGNYTVRLTLNDTLLSSYLDITVKVSNTPPKAVLSLPSRVNEDETFRISAESSWDTWPDSTHLEFLFELDGEPISGWMDEGFMTMSIGNEGIHMIGVKVRDPDGAVALTSSDIEVINVAPAAHMTGPTMLQEDETAFFNASGSYDTISDLPGLRYLWYLNGSDIPFDGGIEINTSFSLSGQYNILLEVIDDDGDVGTDRMNITVFDPPPKAVFDAPRSVMEDEAIVLNASRSSDTPSDAKDLLYFWDLVGEGNFKRGPSVTEIVRSLQGTYTIHLMVMDDDGKKSSANRTVRVMNKVPDPELTGPTWGYEDEPLEFGIDNGTDTVSDMPTLIYEWSVDGGPVICRSDHFIFITDERGDHNITVSITDDDGCSASASRIVNLTNPKPMIILESVPAEIQEGRTFTALAFRTHDNPSDMGLLRFLWFLDGKEVGNGEKNLTVEAKGVGTHTLTLRVIDDEGDFSEVLVVFSVTERSLLLGIFGYTASFTSLIVVIGILVLVLFAAFGIRERIRSLPGPVKDEVVDEETGKEGQGEEGEMEGKEEEREVPAGDGSDEGVKGQGPDGVLIRDDIIDGGEKIIPDPPELDEPFTMPAPPGIEEIEIPEADPHLFDEP